MTNETTAEYTWCPIDPAVCDPAETVQGVLTHLLDEHEPAEVATVLIRHTYIMGQLCSAVNAISAVELRAEREIDTVLPHPGEEETFTEVQFGTGDDQ